MFEKIPENKTKNRKKYLVEDSSCISDTEINKKKVDNVLNNLKTNLNLGFSSLLETTYSENIYGNKVLIFSFNGLNIGVIEYNEYGKELFICLICNVNNKNFGDTDFWGDYFLDEFGLDTDIKLPGFGTHMFLEFMRDFREKGFKKITLTVENGAEGFYEKLIDNYNGVYFDFYKENNGDYIFNLT